MGESCGATSLSPTAGMTIAAATIVKFVALMAWAINASTPGISVHIFVDNCPQRRYHYLACRSLSILLSDSRSRWELAC